MQRIESTVRRLIPIPQWPKFHPDPTPASLRWLVFSNRDGFTDCCVVKRGRRVLIDEAIYRKGKRVRENRPSTPRASGSFSIGSIWAKSSIRRA